MIRVQTSLPICLGLLLLPTVAPAGGEPLRVATLVPFVAEVVDRVPEHAVLVGTVRSGGTSPAAPVMDLGSPHSPSFESLAAANPDVIVVNAAMHAALMPKIERFGKVVAIDTGSVQSTLDGIHALGVSLGASNVIDGEISSARKILDSLRLDPPVSALTLYAAPGEPVVVTGRTWIGDLLSEIGISNVAEGVSGTERYPGYVRVSEEVVAGMRPDCVLLVTHGDPEASLQGFWARVQGEAAWKSVLESVGDRVYVLDPAHFGSNPGLGMAPAAQVLVGQLSQTALAEVEASIP